VFYSKLGKVFKHDTLFSLAFKELSISFSTHVCVCGRIDSHVHDEEQIL